MIDIPTFKRKTFSVKAVRVTLENIAEVAMWCGGQVRNLEGCDGKPCIMVTVGQINGHERLARAYVGNWVTCLTTANSFRVYKDKSFNEAFRFTLSREEKWIKIQDLLQELMSIDIEYSGEGCDDLSVEYASKVLDIVD